MPIDVAPPTFNQFLSTAVYDERGWLRVVITLHCRSAASRAAPAAIFVEAAPLPAAFLANEPHLWAL
jgi:hypothetical protein